MKTHTQHHKYITYTSHKNTQDRRGFRRGLSLDTLASTNTTHPWIFLVTDRRGQKIGRLRVAERDATNGFQQKTVPARKIAIKRVQDTFKNINIR